MNIFRLLKLESKRMFTSTSFWLSIVGETIFMLMITVPMALDGSSSNTVVYLLGFAVAGNGNMLVVLFLLPIFAYALRFVIEWNNRATQFWMIRTGIREYMIPKIIVTACSGFITVVVGIFLYCIVMSFGLPFFDRMMVGNVYSETFERSPVTYIIVYATHLATAGMLVAVAALWVSTYISNIYAAIMGPSVIYWIGLRVSERLVLPTVLRPVSIVEDIAWGIDNWIIVYGFRWGITLLLCFLMALNCISRVQRRVQHD